uniref:Uncharacterized protein n=1 Tax=Cucumis melo TaxID=3656 RepID=A0A9I9ECG6_CUCME
SLFPKLGYRKISSLRLIRRSKEFAKEILGFQSSGRRSGLSSGSQIELGRSSILTRVQNS